MLAVARQFCLFARRALIYKLLFGLSDDDLSVYFVCLLVRRLSLSLCRLSQGMLFCKRHYYIAIAMEHSRKSHAFALLNNHYANTLKTKPSGIVSE